MAKQLFLGKGYGLLCSSSCVTVGTAHQIKVLPQPISCPPIAEDPARKQAVQQVLKHLY